MPFPVTTFKTNHLTIEYDRYSLIINGKREFIRSGAMHYFRLPSQQMWKDRLFQLKAGGYNAVDLYFNWGFHSSESGVYDFTELRDIDALLTMVEEAGLYLIARPGPYINAEVSGGGFPGWLLADKNVRLRHRNSDGAFQWCDNYMAAVKEWWEQIVPKITNCKNLILMQVENEYATLEVEPDYIKALVDLSRELGVTVPLFHNDLYAAGLYEDVVDLYAFDNYSVTSFQQNWREQADTFSVLDNVEENLREFCDNRPLFVAELQAGWYATWKGHAYEEIINHLGREHIAISTRSLIGQGLTLFNHYKAVGGTNWDYIGSTDTYTSYDFAAPISETGIATERLYEAKTINLMLSAFPSLSATKRVENVPNLGGQECFYTLRQPLNMSDGRWLFLRNLNDEVRWFDLSPGTRAVLKPHDCVVLPINILLSSGLTLVESASEVFYQNDHILLVKADRPAQLVLKTANSQSPSVKRISGHGEFKISGADTIINVPELDDSKYSAFSINHLTVLFLSQSLVDRTWHSSAQDIWVGPEQLTLDSQPVFRALPATMLHLKQNGECQQVSFSGDIDPLEPIKLANWEVANVSGPLYRDCEFFQVSENGSDFDSNGFYDGTAWYRLHLSDGAKTITIDARHLWAAYINGQWVGSGSHFLTEQGEIPTEPTTIEIPAEVFSQEGQNELVVLVDSLGHPKGFHDDANQSQGLLSLLVDGVDVSGKVHYSVSFSDVQAKGKHSKTASAVKVTSHFSYTVPGNIFAPLAFLLKDLAKYERINIRLNGFLIGRYWRSCKAQEAFYLPEGLLKTKEKNTIELTVMQFDTLLEIKPIAVLAQSTCIKFTDQLYQVSISDV